MNTVLEISGVGILKCVSVRVAGVLRASVGNTLQERVEVRKIEAAAEPPIEDLRDGSTSELVAKLNVVLARLPGNVVNVMPVGVYALPWIPLVRA